MQFELKGLALVVSRSCRTTESQSRSINRALGFRVDTYRLSGKKVVPTSMLPKGPCA